MSNDLNLIVWFTLEFKYIVGKNVVRYNYKYLKENL